MSLRWFIPSLITTSAMLSASPLLAAQLTNWQFNPNQNQLDVITDSGVQPEAFVLTNPPRVVIDLPNTKLNKSTVRQQYDKLVKEVRVGQTDTNTTRVVMEFTDGYGVTPDQVKVESESPSRWQVRLNQITPQPPTAQEIKQPIAIQPPMFAGVVPLGQELSGLESSVKTVMQRYKGITPGLFFIDVETGNYLDINGDKSFPAASTIKFPILVALFEAVESGRVRLDETLTVRRNLITGGSGDLQYSPGAKLTVLETATKMSVISDNTATNNISSIIMSVNQYKNKPYYKTA